MYSNVQYQPYRPSLFAFDQALEHPPNGYPPSRFQSVPGPQALPQETMHYQPTPQSEAAPPYLEVAFQPQTQHMYQTEGRYEYSRKPSRANEPNHYQDPHFGPPYPAATFEDSPEANPIWATKHTVQHSNLSNNFNDLQIQDTKYCAEQHSAYAPANPTRPCSIPTPSHYQDSEYFRQRPQTPSQISPSIVSNSSDTPSEQQILHQALAFAQASPTPSSNIPLLSRPIGIPQTIPGGGQSFARAWAPSISSHGITQAEFLAFIDGLNIVSTANPPLQILNLAGSVLGLVPHHWAHLAGFAIQTSAQLGTAAISKGRTEMYIKETNEKFFAPRKLKVIIASRDAVGAVVRLPRDDPILAPLTRETMHMSMVERSLGAMKGYVADLDFDVPPPAEQLTMLAKMSAKQIERQGRKNEKKMLKEREKALGKEEKQRAKILETQGKERNRGRSRSESDSDSDIEEEMKPKSKRELKQERSRERKENRNQKKAEKEAEKKRGKKGKDKEAEKAGKLLWILIENL